MDAPQNGAAAATMPVDDHAKASLSNPHNDKPSEDTERQAQELAQQIMDSMQGLGQEPDSMGRLGQESDSQQSGQVEASASEPLTLQEIVHKIFINRLQRAAPPVQRHVMTYVREQLVGLDRIKNLIMEGYTPEQLAMTLAHHDRLVHYLEFVASYAAYLCVGVALTQTFHPLKAVLGSDPTQWPGTQDSTSNLAIKAARSLKANLDHLATLPFDGEVSLTAIIYDPLVDFVNKLKAPGGVLDGDVEWEDQGKKNKQRWDNRLSTALEKLGKKLHNAIQHNQVGCYQKVDAICEQIELGKEGVTYDLFKSLAGFSELPHLAVGPGLGAADEVNLVTENQRLCEAAWRFQQQLHSHLLAIADGIFTSSEDPSTIAKDEGRRAFGIYHLVMNDGPLIETDQLLHRHIPMSSKVAFKAGKASIFAPSPIDVFRDCFTTAWARLSSWHSIGTCRVMDPDQLTTSTRPSAGQTIVALFKHKIHRMSLYEHEQQDEEDERKEEATILYGPRVNLSDSQSPSHALILQAKRQANLLRTHSRAIVLEQAAVAYELWKQGTSRVEATAAQPPSSNGTAEVQAPVCDDGGEKITNGQAESAEASKNSPQALVSGETEQAETSPQNDVAKAEVKTEVGAQNPSKSVEAAKARDSVASLNDMLTALRIGLAGLVDLEPDNTRAKALLKSIDDRERDETGTVTVSATS